MKNLVTGGAGFIGSNLIEKLLNKGEEVICLDNFETSEKSRIKDWLNISRFSFIYEDIVNPIEIEVDRIWHLAAPASPLHYLRDPIQTAKTIFLGTLNMLEIARNCKAKILIGSSSEVYGEPLVHPQSENYFGSVNPIGLRSCYKEGKRISESISFDYYRMYNLKIHIARIFNTYGPGMLAGDGRVISSFINKCLKEEDLIINGDGKQTRSFCYIDDIVDGLIKFMNSKETGPLNLGNPNEEISILELANLICSKTKAKSKLLFIDKSKDDPFKRNPLIREAKSLIDWEPKIEIDIGLSRTIRYFETILN